MALNGGSTKLGSEEHQHNQFPLTTVLRPPGPDVPALLGKWQLV